MAGKGERTIIIVLSCHYYDSLTRPLTLSGEGLVLYSATADSAWLQCVLADKPQVHLLSQHSTKVVHCKVPDPFLRKGVA